MVANYTFISPPVDTQIAWLSYFVFVFITITFSIMINLQMSFILNLTNISYKMFLAGATNKCTTHLYLLDTYNSSCGHILFNKDYVPQSLIRVVFELNVSKNSIFFKLYKTWLEHQRNNSLKSLIFKAQIPLLMASFN